MFMLKKSHKLPISPLCGFKADCYIRYRPCYSPHHAILYWWGCQRDSTAPQKHTALKEEGKGQARVAEDLPPKQEWQRIGPWPFDEKQSSAFREHKEMRMGRGRGRGERWLIWWGREAIMGLIRNQRGSVQRVKLVFWYEVSFFLPLWTTLFIYFLDIYTPWSE